MDEKKKKVKTAKVHRQEILADITAYIESMDSMTDIILAGDLNEETWTI
jgi:hypothetical protein